MQRGIDQTLTTPPDSIVIVDCDHGSVDQERAIADAAGVQLSVANCRTGADVIAAAQDATAVIAQYAPITEEVMAALPHLKVIGRYGVGVDTIDVEAATARGIAVCNVPDYGTEDVSDHAIALITDACRAVTVLDRAVRSGTADLDAVRPIRRFSSQCVGIVGAGLIGRATARKARALGFTVVAADPTLMIGTSVEGIRIVSLDELLRVADIVSLHVPLVPATRHLIDAAALAKMKPSAALVNTCRGGVVSTEDLVDALGRRALRTACLDVFEQEPIDVDHPLATSPYTVLTPHVAWFSEDSFDELKTRVTSNVIAALSGRHIDVVNAADLASRTPVASL